ncbi:MAG: hypothetical protein ABIJ61_09675 [bacterium]
MAFVVVSIMIMAFLDRHGYKTSILWMRLYIFKYVSQYRKHTIADTGSAGPLFYAWIISINLALLAAIGLILSLA